VEARPLLILELPVPTARTELEWNRWYNDVHIPDMLKTVPGVLHGTRYRLVCGDSDVRYLAIYEFESTVALRSYLDSPLIEARWQAYADEWGTDRPLRRRGFEPIFEARARNDL
jgi:hypothetical protein